MCQWARVSAATHRGAQRATSATRHFCVRARSRPTRPSQRRRRRRTRGGSLAACSALARSAQSAPDWRYACSAHLCRAPQAQYLVQTWEWRSERASLPLLTWPNGCSCAVVWFASDAAGQSRRCSARASAPSLRHPLSTGLVRDARPQGVAIARSGFGNGALENAGNRARPSCTNLLFSWTGLPPRPRSLASPGAGLVSCVLSWFTWCVRFASYATPVRPASGPPPSPHARGICERLRLVFFRPT